jgi:glycosyltransferase involved in cell wall biosynthesis
MAKHIILDWQISTGHGWGVYGLNLALNWASDSEIESATSIQLDSTIIDIDPMRTHALAPFIRRSSEFQYSLQKFANTEIEYNGTLLASLNHTFLPSASAHNVLIAGKPSIGIIFSELAPAVDAIARARKFPLVVTGSTWNENVLRSCGITNVRTVLQGVDTTHFHPAPKLNLFRDRFLIFSGGKAEYRKAQDLVLSAFKVFFKRHPEALLVTAWWNPWPDTIRSLDLSGYLCAVVLDKANQIDVYGWAAANDIPRTQVMDLGFVPNLKMPGILREMDVAVFPNRGEGGTNLVAMECMACGLPTILSRNTGHLDLIDENEACYWLHNQGKTLHGLAGVNGVPGWGESNVDEIVERLEQVFCDRAGAARRGRRAAEHLAQLTWKATATRMKDIIMNLA